MNGVRRGLDRVVTLNMDRRTKILAIAFGAVTAYLALVKVVYPNWLQPLLSLDERVAQRREVLDRLRFSGSDRDYVANLVREHMFHYTSDWSDGAVRLPDRLRGDAVMAGCREAVRYLLRLRSRDGGVHFEMRLCPAHYETANELIDEMAPGAERNISVESQHSQEVH